MKTYSVQPVFDSDHTMNFTAVSEMDAAARYIAGPPGAEEPHRVLRIE